MKDYKDMTDADLTAALVLSAKRHQQAHMYEDASARKETGAELQSLSDENDLRLRTRKEALEQAERTFKAIVEVSKHRDAHGCSRAEEMAEAWLRALHTEEADDE